MSKAVKNLLDKLYGLYANKVITEDQLRRYLQEGLPSDIIQIIEQDEYYSSDFIRYLEEFLKAWQLDPLMQSPNFSSDASFLLDLTVSIRQDILNNLAQQSYSVIETAILCEYIILLDGVGSGKTASLRKIALTVAEERLDELRLSDKFEANLFEDKVRGIPMHLSSVSDEEISRFRINAPIPIFFRLPDLVKYLPNPLADITTVVELLENLIHNEAPILDLLSPVSVDRLSNDYFIFLLDSLDEVSEGDANRINEFIDHLYKICMNQDHRIIISCRDTKFQELVEANKYSFVRDFVAAKVEPMNTQQINEFVYRWARALGKNDEDEIAALQDSINQDDWSELLETPLMAAVFITTHIKQGGSTQIEKRTKFLERFLENKIFEWPFRETSIASFSETVNNPDYNSSILKNYFKTPVVNLHAALNRLGLQVLEGRSTGALPPVGKLRHERELTIEYVVESIADSVNWSPDDEAKDIHYAKLFVTHLLRCQILLIRDTDSDPIVKDTKDNRLVRFAHNSFTEFLASRHLVSMRQREQEDHIFKFVKLSPDTWRETLSMSIEHNSDPKDGAYLIEHSYNLLRSLEYEIMPDQQYSYWLIVLRMLKTALSTWEANFDVQKNLRGRDVLKQISSKMQKHLDEAYFPNVQHRKTYARILSEIGEHKNLTNFVHRKRTQSQIPIPQNLYWVPINEDFAITKYPITNSQFIKFYETDYTEIEYWNGLGLDITMGTQPNHEFLEKYKLERQNFIEKIESSATAYIVNSDYPASTTWYEANAFCRWLSALSNCEIDLPTTEEWELSAGVIDNDNNLTNRIEKSNWSYANFNSTELVPVGIFPETRSNENVDDMIGNVWEWCKDKSDAALQTFEARGGSYNHSVPRGVSDIRVSYYGHTRSLDLGFRPVLRRTNSIDYERIILSK